MSSVLVTARAARPLVFVMALALACGSIATCLAAVAEAEPTMLCHSTERHPAPDHSARWDCCPGEAPNTLGSMPVQETLASSVPSPVLLALLPMLAEPQVGTRAGIVDAAAGAPKPPGIATYVLVSSFRV